MTRNCTFYIRVWGMLLGSVLSLSSLAHTGRLQGYVTDAGTGEALVGATVSLQGTAWGSTTNLFGRFSIPSLAQGAYTVVVSYIGYVTYVDTVEVVPDKTVTLNIRLQAGILKLADLVVTGRTPDQELNSVSSLDINLRPVNNSQDILRLVPGLFIAQHAGGGKAEQIFLRGFDIDHGTDINLSVDGMPVNMVSHAHGQGYADLHFVIPETIEKVDFNKGPYYADKGDFTTAGYAAFNTYNKIDKNLVKLEGGMYGTMRSVMLLNLLDKVSGEAEENWYVASEYFLSDGYFDSPQNFNRINLMTKYTHRFSDTQLLTASAATFSSRWDASGQIPGRAVESGMISRFGAIDDTEGGETSRTNFTIRYQKALPNEDLFEHQAYLSLYDFYLVSNFTFFLNDAANGDQITQRESRKLYGYKGSYIKNTALGRSHLLSEWGGGLRYDDVNDIRLSHTLNRKDILEDLAFGDIDQTNLHLYANETFEFGALKLQAALRYDHFVFSYDDKLAGVYARETVNKNLVSPKLSLNYAVTPQTLLYAKAGLGFHSNDTRVVVAQKGETILPRAKGVDVGTVWKPAKNMMVHVAGWILDLEQEFVYVGDEGVVEPGGATLRKGIDVSVRAQLGNSIYADADITLTEARAKNALSGENYIPLAPSFSSIGGLTYRSSYGLNASVRYRYLDDRPANEHNDLVAAGYLLVDAVITYKKRNYEFSVSGENLLDVAWREAQFETETRLRDEPASVSEIHFTPGTPLFLKAGISVFF